MWGAFFLIVGDFLDLPTYKNFCGRPCVHCTSCSAPYVLACLYVRPTVCSTVCSTVCPTVCSTVCGVMSDPHYCTFCRSKELVLH